MPPLLPPFFRRDPIVGGGSRSVGRSSSQIGSKAAHCAYAPVAKLSRAQGACGRAAQIGLTMMPRQRTDSKSDGMRRLKLIFLHFASGGGYTPADDVRRYSLVPRCSPLTALGWHQRIARAWPPLGGMRALKCAAMQR